MGGCSSQEWEEKVIDKCKKLPEGMSISFSVGPAAVQLRNHGKGSGTSKPDTERRGEGSYKAIVDDKTQT